MLKHSDYVRKFTLDFTVNYCISKFQIELLLVCSYTYVKS